MSSRRSHAEQVRDLFDREASGWNLRYAPGAAMQGRIDRFCSALVPRVPTGQRVLDLGCGSGQITRAIASKGWRTTGCDISTQMLDKARSETGALEIEWVGIDPAETLSLPFEDCRFGAVIASSVLEYLDHPRQALREIGRVLAVGGYLLATVPDLRHPVRAAEGWRAKAVANPVIHAAFRLTPWRGYADYLRLSMNRLDLKLWHEMARSVGLEPEPAGPCEDSLAMILARKNRDPLP